MSHNSSALGNVLEYEYQAGPPPHPVTGGAKDVEALAAGLGGVNISAEGYDHGYGDTGSYYPDGAYQHGGYPEGEYPGAGGKLF